MDEKCNDFTAKNTHPSQTGMAERYSRSFPSRNNITIKATFANRGRYTWNHKMERGSSASPAVQMRRAAAEQAMNSADKIAKIPIWAPNTRFSFSYSLPLF